MVNPWNLTSRQAEVVAALVEHGSAKAAAIKLGVSHRRSCNLLRESFARMKVHNDVQAALAWDRWQRGRKEA